jgi:hypothetical protein
MDAHKHTHTHIGDSVVYGEILGEFGLAKIPFPIKMQSEENFGSFLSFSLAM